MAYDQTAADAIRELDEWKQAAAVEAQLRREAHAEIDRLRTAIRRAGVSLDQGMSKESVSEQLRDAINHR